MSLDGGSNGDLNRSLVVLQGRGAKYCVYLSGVLGLGGPNARAGGTCARSGVERRFAGDDSLGVRGSNICKCAKGVGGVVICRSGLAITVIGCCVSWSRVGLLPHRFDAGHQVSRLGCGE